MEIEEINKQRYEKLQETKKIIKEMNKNAENYKDKRNVDAFFESYNAQEPTLLELIEEMDLDEAQEVAKMDLVKAVEAYVEGDWVKSGQYLDKLVEEAEYYESMRDCESLSEATE